MKTSIDLNFYFLSNSIDINMKIMRNFTASLCLVLGLLKIKTYVESRLFCIDINSYHSNLNAKLYISIL